MLDFFNSLKYRFGCIKRIMTYLIPEFFIIFRSALRTWIILKKVVWFDNLDTLRLPTALINKTGEIFDTVLGLRVTFSMFKIEWKKIKGLSRFTYEWTQYQYTLYCKKYAYIDYVNVFLMKVVLSRTIFQDLCIIYGMV